MENEVLYATSIVAIYKKDEKEKKYKFDTFCFVDETEKILTGNHIGKYLDVDSYFETEVPLEILWFKNNNAKTTILEEISDTDYLWYRVNFNFVDLEYPTKEILKQVNVDDENEYIDILNIKKHIDESIKKGDVNLFNVFFHLIYKMISKFDKVELKNNKAIYERKADKDKDELLKDLNSNKQQSIVNVSYAFGDTLIEIRKYMLDSLVKINNKDINQKLDDENISLDGFDNKTQTIMFLQRNTKIEKDELENIVNENKTKFICQEDAVEEIALNIYFNTQLINDKDNDTISRIKSTMLLDGPTGTGKTAILKSIANKFNLPIVITGITQYSSVGFKGANLTDILESLLVQTNGNIEEAERGIVCIDEFDKIASKESMDLTFKEGIQNELLKFIEGNVYQIEYDDEIFDFDTSKLTIVCSGAFTTLHDNKEQKNTSHPLGFGSKEVHKDEEYEIEDEEYVNYGIQRELLGRLKVQIHTNKYSKEDYIRIMKESNISPLKDLENAFAINNIKFTYTDEFLNKCAEIAYKRNKGVRGLQSIFDEIRSMYLKKLIFTNTKEFVLDEEIIDKLKKRKKRKLLEKEI